MKYQITSNTKNIGKRNIYFNKPLTIKLYDGIIEKQYNIKPGESIIIIVDDKSGLPWHIYDLEKKGLLKISVIYNIVFEHVNNEIEYIKEVSDKFKDLGKEPITDIKPLTDLSKESFLPKKNNKKKNKQ